MTQTICITGGHITPAVAVITELCALHADWKLFCIGRSTALEGSAVRSEEERILSALGVPFFPITAGRLKRDGGLGAVVALAKTPVGFFQSLWYVARMRPTLVMSFGGYVALPVVLAAWIFRIPVITHEQTTRAGLANRIIATIARKTCVSFPSTQSSLSGSTVVTGLPLREGLFHPIKKAPWKEIEKKKPIILVVGGSTGAQSMNRIVYRALAILLPSYEILHQVGRFSIEEAQKEREMIPQELRMRYHPFAYLTEQEYSWALTHARIVIGRSGANTVLELAAVGKPAVLIPLPWSSANEQYHNARFLEQNGSAVILDQSMTTADSLVSAVSEIEKEYDSFQKSALALSKKISRDGATNIVRVIESVLS